MEAKKTTQAATDSLPEGLESQKDNVPGIPTTTQTFLFDLPLPDDETVPPVPSDGEDKWDDDHVKLPTNPLNLYMEIDESGELSQKSRWNLVKEALTASPITDSHKLEEAIKKYTSKKDLSFKALHQLFDDDFSEDDSALFFESVLPKMIELALRLPELIKSAIPFLKKETNHTLSLSQEQAACLLTNAFFCTFPGRKWKTASFPEINFYRLYGCAGDHVVEKLKCILHYFKRVCEDMPNGVLTFQRRFIKKDNFPDFEQSTLKLSSVKVTMSADQRIEEGTGMLQVDFANRFLGGGVLGWGCVQEEIRFVINPEMIVGMLFCESMNITEAILMTGSERFSNYEGYSSSFKWAGRFDDETPRDELRRRKTYVVAIDAMCTRSDLQFMEVAMAREIRKATVGFFHDPQDPTDPITVCSGNWGCGAFGGDVKLKALIQIIACCLNRRDLVYCTFGNYQLMEEVTKMTDFFKKHEITVETLWKYMKAFKSSEKGTLWKYLKAFKACQKAEPSIKLYSYIYKQISKSKSTETTAFERKETVINMDTGCIENPPAKKQRTSEPSDEAENEVLASSVASLNVKLTSIDASKCAAEASIATVAKDDSVPEKSPEKPKIEQTEAVIDDKKKFKITDFFKLK